MIHIGVHLRVFTWMRDGKFGLGRINWWNARFGGFRAHFLSEAGFLGSLRLRLPLDTADNLICVCFPSQCFIAHLFLSDWYWLWGIRQLKIFEVEIEN